MLLSVESKFWVFLPVAMSNGKPLHPVRMKIMSNVKA